MEEIIKLQIKALEVKLTVAKNERIDDLKAKIKKLEDMLKPVESVKKKSAPVVKPKRVAQKRKPKPVVREEPKEELPLEVQEEIKEVMVEEPVKTLTGGTLVLDAEHELTKILEEEIEKAKEELPTVEEVEKEIEELPIIGGDNPSNEEEVAEISFTGLTPIETAEFSFPDPDGEEGVTIFEKESESDQIETNEVDPEKDPVEDEKPPEAAVIEVPVVEAPVVETETTTKKKRKYTKRKRGTSTAPEKKTYTRKKK